MNAILGEGPGAMICNTATVNEEILKARGGDAIVSA